MYFLYNKLSIILKDIIIENTENCDLFDDCSILYKQIIDYKCKEKVNFDPVPEDIFEFKNEQNVPYQITVEFRFYKDLYLSILCSPFKYDTKLEYSYTVDDVKKHTIAILNFYEPLFKNCLYPDTEEKEKELTTKPIYTTSYKCSEPESQPVLSTVTDQEQEPLKKKGCCEWLTGIFVKRFKSKKNKKINVKSISKKIKKSILNQSLKKQKKSNAKSISKKIKKYNVKSISKKNKKSNTKKRKV